MSGALDRSALAPWAGLLVAPPAWFGHHQLGSIIDFVDCRRGDVVLYLLLGGGFGALAVLGAVISWAARGSPADSATRPETRRFAGYFSTGLAGMFLLAIFLQTLGAVLSPRCFP